MVEDSFIGLKIGSDTASPQFLSGPLSPVKRNWKEMSRAPLALLALVVFPILWLISLPLRLVAITFEAIFALLGAVLFLPARLLGFGRCRCHR
jgi:hypothetical protein